MCSAHDVSRKVYKNSGNQAVLSRVPSTAENVLDVGCGAGDNARMIRLSGPRHCIIGVTAAEDEAELAREVCDQVILANLEDGLPPLSDTRFDVVVCSHVLEHICFPDRLLQDIFHVLADDGRLVVALPNLMYYKSRAKLLLGRFDYQESGIMDNTHFRWYTFSSAKRLLETHSFDVLESAVTSSVPLPLLRKFLPDSITSSLDALGGWISPGLFGAELIYVCRKRTD